MIEPPPGLADCPAALLADVGPTWKQPQLQLQQLAAGNNSKATSTDPVQVHDTDTQTTERCDAGCQASTSGRTSSAGAGQQRGRGADPHMPAFLQRVAPSMLAALSANSEALGAGVRGRPAGATYSNSMSKEGSSARCLFTLSAFSCNSGSSLTQTTAANTTANTPTSSNNTNNTTTSRGAAAGGRVGRSTANPHKLVVTSLTWSKTGQTLAASFGRYDISSWCCTPGAIATWNLARLGTTTTTGTNNTHSRSDSSSSSGRPDRLIDVDACVMCCAFHPAEPALLAGGTFNGELVIWDLSREDAHAQVAKTDVLSELRHREPITAISWQHSAHEARRRGAAASTAYRLFTLGADGRLLVWLWDQIDNPIFGYELRVVQPGQDPRTCLGGSCMAFCPSASAHEEASTLLVGTEGGQLLRCQVNDMSEVSLKDFSTRLAAAAAAPPGSGSSSIAGSKVELRSAVASASASAASLPQGAAASSSRHKPFAGSVTAVAASPHHRQLAIAASVDGTLRVLDVLRSDPLLLLEPAAGGLMAAAWSPSRPLVFAAASANCVHLYDLGVKQRIVRPVLQLPVTADTTARGCGATAIDGSINVVTFNAQVPGMLAAAAGDVVSVWQLPQGLVEPRTGELKLLRRMLDSEDVSALLRVQGIVG